MSFVFNCFCAKQNDDVSKNKKESDFISSIVNSSANHNVVVLPVRNSFELDNLYPKHNHVDKWNTFIIGKDKTYILANCVDFNINNLVNHKGTGILPQAIEEFLDPIWDRTLEGKQVQLFMMFDSTTYLMNSYTLKNNADQIIGACLFMRRVDSLPNTIFQTTSSLSHVHSADDVIVPPNTITNTNTNSKNKRYSLDVGKKGM
jgi:hypothetical protein